MNWFRTSQKTRHIDPRLVDSGPRSKQDTSTQCWLIQGLPANTTPRPNDGWFRASLQTRHLDPMMVNSGPPSNTTQRPKAGWFRASQQTRHLDPMMVDSGSLSKHDTYNQGWKRRLASWPPRKHDTSTQWWLIQGFPANTTPRPNDG